MSFSLKNRANVTLESGVRQVLSKNYGNISPLFEKLISKIIKLEWLT
ncbi:hypothetical protein HMPREF9095_0827 [Haemophilus aegyptius ATCC 11116]|uniref:Uncharacterized protein n=1 Tax=Haemophilus influenzae TaxID=727 RepID=A0A158SVN5_HAEIF|nr:hypothetical protein HMPREF9095_0827 [Haemophilus aegyptius ATCC 11116]KIS34929.1 hypothetical protein NTHI1209_00532 [Haemophilus influenzae]